LAAVILVTDGTGYRSATAKGTPAVARWLPDPGSDETISFGREAGLKRSRAINEPAKILNPASKEETPMTEPNNENREPNKERLELTIAELEAVNGGTNNAHTLSSSIQKKADDAGNAIISKI